MQALLRRYKSETGIREVDMREFAAYMINMGWPMPTPVSPLDILAKQAAAAAREETRVDAETGQSYRVNHMYPAVRGGEQLHLWIDIDEADRGPMHTSLTLRREQIVGDITQLTFDAEHWNRVNESEEPIEIEKDFGLDVEIRRNAPAPV
jgi:hypothetical protein